MADTDAGWAVIGHLQTNKARYVARFAQEFHALDSLRLAEALARRLEREGRGLDVYVQVNTSGEASKCGLAPEDVAGVVRELGVYSSLRVRGLMALAIFSKDADEERGCFRRLRGLRDQLREEMPEPGWFDELSMGMSGDFEVAIEEGATVVRVG
nr:YggS family pyridoxal phosphate-dependent enzyme [Lujinxingia litoralis]